MGTRLRIEMYGREVIRGMYHGIDPYTWRLQLLTDSHHLDARKTQQETNKEKAIRSISFKDIKRMGTEVRLRSGSSTITDAEETMSSIRWFLLHQQLRRFLQSQLTSLLRVAMALRDTRDIEFGFEGVCCELEIEHAKTRLHSLAALDSVRAPAMDPYCHNWADIAKCLTEFDRILLKSTCLYFNALQCADADECADPERILLRKAAYHVLDASQNVDDLFVDTHANADAFRLGGTPAVCISALHLAARLGDSAMCDMLLKQCADVNVNVRLLPVPRIEEWEHYHGLKYDLEEGLPAAHTLEMNTIRTDEYCEGFGYMVDSGHVTPLRMAQHFHHHAVETLLRQHSGHSGHSPPRHYLAHGHTSEHDAPDLAERWGIPYVGTYERPHGRGTCVGSCLLYSWLRTV